MYFNKLLQYVKEQEIKIFLENALRVSMELLKTTEEIFKKENLPIPKGFSEEDLTLLLLVYLKMNTMFITLNMLQKLV